MATIKGYKVFNPDWTCRGFQYQVGETFVHNGNIEMCGAGFHFCQKASDCFNYYDFDSRNKVAEVEALGLVETHGDKSVTDKIRIVREISWQELLTIVNEGHDCTGNYNTGNRNTGDYNTGNRNTGNYNTGNGNTGNGNTGNYNTGSRNAGSYNTGSRNTGGGNTGSFNTGSCNAGSDNAGSRNTGGGNTGSFNTGSRNAGSDNAGDYNVGDCNTGDYNTGCWNTGSRNAGDCNTGDYNTGDYNTGCWNTGSRNAGDCNTGDCNTGGFNKCDFSTGFFNTKRQPIYAFNKPLPERMTYEDFYSCSGVEVLKDCFKLTEWIYKSDMTDEEKENYPEYKTTGGYLRVYTYEKAWQNLWDKLTDDEKQIVKEIPNFDPEVFKEITGIDVNEN